MLAKQTGKVEGQRERAEMMLEICVEELPGGKVVGVAREGGSFVVDVEALLGEVLKSEGLGFEGLTVDATSRTVVARVAGLEIRQKDERKRKRSPLRAAVGKDGQLT